MIEEETTTKGKLEIAGKWLRYMKAVQSRDALSAEEMEEIDAVYEIIKEAIY